MVRILVIDDDGVIQTFLSRALQKEYEVFVASDGEEGLKQAGQLKPAMIICDWMMPGIDGLEVCRQIKLNPQLSTTFFILLTSLGSVEDRVKGLDAGADDFLCKPIEINELRARVRAGIRLHQLSHDLQAQKQLLEMELAEAADYVRSLLPEFFISPKLAIDFRFLPSRRLGGDGFDYYWLDNDHLMLYLLDVAGHGLRAALPSLSVIHLLRSRGLSQVNYYQPNQVLQGLNQVYQISPKNDKYFTIWYGIYDQKQQQLTYASAGHPPAVLLTKKPFGQMIETRLKAPGFPIGMFPEAEYTNQVQSLNLPSSLYLFSDGIYEIDCADGRMWGLENFIQSLRNYHCNYAKNLDNFIEEIQALQFDGNFNDDLSIMQVDFH
ncbi:MAG: SpoIIE family protein phosphatase [Microcystis sp. M54BS1]|jgi:sigma-B regulation protein RsbU (phosphoserine phosphatase)|uniref:Two-component response regulator n=1 Tax=Microcystis aeruginosa PCC 9443 TaxID=1160281 RepID=I4G4W5_MICAE|nr:MULTISPECIES: SpoIIE family protein phosphatase [Microcystis]MBE5231256.1 SpoIIE family protein phosphatase [Microcystis aeruginosa PMC 728.11]MCA2541085.1 SpoIIE family protein phosphatase [Microcystis sp. M54BS1]MCA2594951.1 SpoIIE family protein phosphatase [Microcystis sp. M38BS1]MCA2610115.1 SpoIIE family protein phosphatase [Microcystis sp. M27BS1]NCS29707.1 SpoIIE family protein phosphatase [Microcystis aeruginosa F13-15]